MRSTSALALLAWLVPAAWSQFLPNVQLSPVRIPAGSGDTTITVSGTQFKSSFQVYWNGSPRPTQVVSAWTIKVLVPSTDLLTPGLAQISLYDNTARAAVSNPTPFLIYLPLMTADLAYDSTRMVIYAALTHADPNGPAVAIIDPAKGIVERYIPLSGDPTTLALSVGAQYLYIGMSDRVHRSDLTGTGSDTDFLFAGLPQNSSSGAATSILPLPGDGTSYVVVLGADYYSAFAVDGSTPRPNHSNAAPRCLVGQLNGTSLYGGPGFTALTLGATGLPYSATVGVPGLASGPACPAFGNGILYGSNGDIVNPTIPALVGRFPASGMVDAAAERNQIYFLGSNAASSVANVGLANLTVFDATTYARLQLVALPVVLSSYTGRMIHWGTDGVAFGDYSQVNTTVSDGLYLFQLPPTN